MPKVVIRYKISVIGGMNAINHFDGECDEQSLSRMLLAANQDAIDWCIKSGPVGVNCQINVTLSIIGRENQEVNTLGKSYGGPG